jgi:hypothetical protein
MEAGLASKAAAHYLRLMPLPRPASPRVLMQDLRDFWRARPRGHWIAAALAATVTTGILLAFYIDSRQLAEPREQIIFLDSWPANRTDDQIRAQQKADLDARTRAEAEHRRQLQRIDQNLNRLGI